MPIALVGEVHVPATENGSSSGTLVTIDKDAAAWAGLVAGDTIIVYLVHRRTTSPSWTVATTGGQTWTEVIDAALGMTTGLYTAIFNGTWTADPAFQAAGASGSISGWALALSGVDPTIWDVTPTFATDATTDLDFATWSTLTDGAWAIVWGSTNVVTTATVDNGFVAPSGAGIIYWRNTGGSDLTQITARKLLATAGAVGATVVDWTTPGSNGGKGFAAIKPAAAAAAVQAFPVVVG